VFLKSTSGIAKSVSAGVGRSRQTAFWDAANTRVEEPNHSTQIICIQIDRCDVHRFGVHIIVNIIVNLVIAERDERAAPLMSLLNAIQSLDALAVRRPIDRESSVVVELDGLVVKKRSAVLEVVLDRAGLVMVRIAQKRSIRLFVIVPPIGETLNPDKARLLFVNWKENRSDVLWSGALRQGRERSAHSFVLFPVSLLAVGGTVACVAAAGTSQCAGFVARETQRFICCFIHWSCGRLRHRVRRSRMRRVAGLVISATVWYRERGKKESARRTDLSK
jgi:hypothetical protein